MSILAQTDLRRPTHQTLPTMYDLPSEESGEPGMPDEFHPHQAVLLSETFHPTTVPPDQFLTAIDLNLYYDSRHHLRYKRPDWFAVVGTPSLYDGHDLRMSYVIWHEGVVPLIIVELLSPKTEKADLGKEERDEDGTPTKWEVYEQILGVPYYAVFSRVADRLRIFRLSGGKYIEVVGHHDRFWMPEAGLGLGVWRGIYKGPERLWLRWYDAEGNWIPTNAERAEQERQRAEQERWRAEQERLRAKQEQRRAEHERLLAEQEHQRAQQAQQRADHEQQRADQQQQRAEQQQQRAEQEQQRAEQEQREKEAALLREAQSLQRAEQAEQRAEEERRRAERLAEMLRQLGRDPNQL